MPVSTGLVEATGAAGAEAGAVDATDVVVAGAVDAIAGAGAVAVAVAGWLAGLIVSFACAFAS